MMLKLFFWSLVLANGALFAFHQGYLGAFLSDGREPARMANQMNPDSIHLIEASKIGNTSNIPNAPIPEPTKEFVDTKPEVIACTEIGNFNTNEAALFESKLALLSFGQRLSQRKLQVVANHMVYIPPQGSKENADKKAGELRRLGVNDFYIIQDNPAMPWSISLGIFKTEESARSHLANLTQKGVHSARIAVRTALSSLLAFQLRDIDATEKANLEKIKADFPRQEIRVCE